EALDIVALRCKATGLAERGTEIAYDIPASDLTAPAHLVDRVVRVLQIPAVEDEQDREQSFIRARADERVLPPRPRIQSRERWLLQPETPARHDARARLV